MSAPSTRARLAKVHIAKKELGLDEATYRAVLVRVTGRESAGACGEAQLDAVLEEFKRLGWKPPEKRRPKSENPQVRMIWALWAELCPSLRDGSAAALRSFCRRMTRVDDPEWLDGKQANLVIEALKAWIERVQKPAEEAVNHA
jgi:phage gp16-like protein